MLAMMCSQFGGVVVTGTDNLLISAFVGVRHVAVYSNYVMINTMIQGVITQIYSSVTATVGNLNATEDSEHLTRCFLQILL